MKKYLFVSLIIISLVSLGFSTEVEFSITETATISHTEGRATINNILLGIELPRELASKNIDVATLRIPIDADINPPEELVYIDLKPLNTGWSEGIPWSSIWFDDSSGAFIEEIVTSSFIMKDRFGNLFVEFSIEKILEDWLEGNYHNYGVCIIPKLTNADVKDIGSPIQLRGYPHLKIDYSNKFDDE
ncbi:hypothetical protein JW877_05140 [bacterium]|nr:hypothetical protein [bacterium]